MNNIGTVIKNAGKALVLSAIISSMALLGVIFNTDKDMGNSIMEIAYNNKLWDGKNGFDFSNSATLLTKSFAKYNVNKKGNIDRYDIYDELVSEVNAGRVCIFMLKEHETVGCGHTTFVIKYTVYNSKTVFEH